MASTITGEPTLTVGALLAELEKHEALRGTVVTKNGTALLIPQWLVDYPAEDSMFLLCFADLTAKSIKVTTLRQLLGDYPPHFDLYLGIAPSTTQMPLGIVAVHMARNLVALECGICWFAY